MNLSLVENRCVVGPVPNLYLKCSLTCIASCYKHGIHTFGNSYKVPLGIKTKLRSYSTCKITVVAVK